MVGPDKHYRAFISYSQQDREWGKRLHGWLETYRVPLGAQVDVQLPHRLGRFFRDDEDMAAAASIADIVQGALLDAESLIVICSPRSAQSKWVNAEIQHFRQTGRGRKIFAFIIDGIPNSGDPATECFPPALRATGDPEHPEALPIEPLGLDVRKDGRAKACARLAAGLLGVDFDDLWQRDRRRAEQRQRIVMGGLATVSVVFAALAATSLNFGFQSQRRAAILSIEGARGVLQEGDAQGALLVLLEAAKSLSGKGTPDRLLIAFDEALQRATAETIYPLPAGAELMDAARGVYILDPEKHTVSLLDASGPPRIVAQTDVRPLFAGDAPDGNLIVVRDDLKIEQFINGKAESLGAFDSQAVYGTPDSREYAGVRFSELSISPDGMLLLQPQPCEEDAATDCNDNTAKMRVQTFDLSARRLVFTDMRRPRSQYNRVYYVRAPDGRRILFTGEDAVTLDGKPLRPGMPKTDLLALWCKGGERMGAAMKASFARIFNEGGALDFPLVHCDASDGATLLQIVTGMVLDGRGDYLLTDEDEQVSDIQTRLKEDFLADETKSYDIGSLRGAYLGQLTGVRYDAGTFALTYGRDVAIGADTLFEWRMPNLVSYVQLLDNQKAAVADLNGGAIRVLDYSTHHPYAARPLSEAETERYYPSIEKWPDRCPPLSASIDGAKLTLDSRNGAPDGAHTGQTTTITLASPKRTVERKIEVDGACARLSPDGRYLGLVDADRVAHIIDLRRMWTRAPDAEIGALPQAVDFAFSGRGSEIVLARDAGADAKGYSRGLVIERLAMSSTSTPEAWRVVQTLYRGTGNQHEAKLDARGERAILFEELGTEQDRGALLLSLGAQQIWRRLGAEYRWLDAGFLDTGEVYVLVGYEDNGVARLLAIKPHDRIRARTAAIAALSPHCRAFPGNSYRASPCWPKQFAE